LSECSADTLRRANAVHPIAAAEIEVSPWSYEEETKKVIATAEKLGVAVIAYSPLGHGMFTGVINNSQDVSSQFRAFSRLQGTNLDHNLAMANALAEVAHRKGITPAQLSISWVSSLGQHVIPLPGSSHSKRTLENLRAGDVTLSDEEQKDISDILATYEVKGGRYFGNDRALLLWG